jgi:tripartite-type tricarboxylate transporter receptor subunit TctC
MKKINLSSRIFGVAQLFFCLLTPGYTLAAEDYPNKPIRIVLPFAAGGGPDVVARLLANQLSKQLNQSVIVDNKPGGNAIVATEFVAHSRPDGYTLLLTTGSHTTNPTIYKKLPYDSVADFAPISLLRVTSGFVFVVTPNAPYKNLRELIVAAKSGQVFYGSPGIGNSLHLPGELLNVMASTDMQHVPYKGAAPALNAVMAGEIQATFQSVTAVLPSIKAGLVRPIAVTSSKRLPTLSDIPTFSEAGVPGYIFAGGWQGIFAPAGTSPKVINKLAAEMKIALNSPELRDKILAEDASPIGNSPEEFAVFLTQDAATSKKIIQSIGLQGKY